MCSDKESIGEKTVSGLIDLINARFTSLEGRIDELHENFEVKFEQFDSLDKKSSDAQDRCNKIEEKLNKRVKMLIVLMFCLFGLYATVPAEGITKLIQIIIGALGK